MARGCIKLSNLYQYLSSLISAATYRRNNSDFFTPLEANFWILFNVVLVYCDHDTILNVWKTSQHVDNKAWLIDRKSLFVQRSISHVK